MKIQYDAAEFTSACQRLVKAVGKPFSGKLELSLRASNGVLSVHAWGTAFGRVDLHGFADEGIVAIGADDLLKMVAASKKDDQGRFCIDVEGGRAKAKSKSGGALSLAVMPPEGAVEMPAFEAEYGRVLLKTLKDAYDAVAHAMGRDTEVRAAQAGMSMRVSPEGFQVVATDGLRFGICHLKLDRSKGETLAPGDYRISPMVIDAVPVLYGRKPEANQLVDMAFPQGRVILRMGSLTLLAPGLEGKFPPIERMVPDPAKVKTRIEVKAALLVERLKALKDFPGLNSSAVTLRFLSGEAQYLTLSAESPTSSASETLGAVVDGPDGQAKFNLEYLMDAAEAATVGDPDARVELRFVDSLSPCQIVELPELPGYACFGLVMPVR